MKNFKLVTLVLAGMFYRPFYRAWAFHNSPNLLSRSLLKHSLFRHSLLSRNRCNQH